jgi:leader peptidase (prepilin peptidase)/N-methyltransferase
MTTALFLTLLLYSALVVVLFAIIIVDYRTKTIPDSLWIALFILAGIRFILQALGAIEPTQTVSLESAVVGSFIVSVPLLVIASRTAGFGGGDVKLMFAAGLYLGWQQVLLAFFIGVILGALASFFLLLTNQATRKSTIAFGPYLATGIAIAAFWGQPLLDFFMRL